MSFEGGGSFGGAVFGIIAGIGNFVAHWFGITAKELLRLVTYLKDHIVELSRALLNGVLKLGRALARAVVSMLRLTVHGLKTLALWANRKLLALERYLKDKFGPILRWLKLVKDHLDDFYKRFVRPIIDTIEFIRQLNRVLQVFHINLLRTLDATLAKIEQKIDEPFLWVRAHITEIENLVNRVLTLDGLFQRLTLIRSMAKYAPNWTNGFWNSQIDVNVLKANDYKHDLEYPVDEPASYASGLAQFYRGEGGDMKAAIDELLPLWREAAGISNG